MAKPTHQLGKGRAGLGGEDGPGVAEVVPAEVLSAGCLPGRVVDLVERRGRHVGVAVGCGRKEQCVLGSTGVVLQVRLHDRDQVGRDRDVAHACVRLGRADDELAAGPHNGAANVDAVVAQVDVTPAQFGQLDELPSYPRRTSSQPDALVTHESDRPCRSAVVRTPALQITTGRGSILLWRSGATS